MTIIDRIHARWRDFQHERRIEAACHRYWTAYVAGSDEVTRAVLWSAFARLVNSRSPAQIERMERARGLR